MRNVLLTGCAGYIGSIVTQYLLDVGFEVTGLDSLIYHNETALLPYLGHKRFKFVKGDIRETSLLTKLVRETDVVIHAAALVGAGVCDLKPEEAQEVNTKATETLTYLLKPSQKMVFLNTNSGYGQTSGESECVETDRLNPISLYGKTKVEAERIVLDHPQATVLRLATVFGISPRPRLDLLVNDVVEKLCICKQRRKQGVEEAHFTIYEPHFLRNFIHVRDVARAIIHVLGRGLTGVYNVGNSSCNMSKMDLIRFICKQIGLDESVVRVGVGKDIDARNYRVSNAKIEATGWFPAHSLADGVAEIATLCEMLSLKECRYWRNS